MRRRTALRRSNLRVQITAVEGLEIREVLSATTALAGLTVAPMFAVTPFTGIVPPSTAFTPAQIRQAYGFAGVSFNGTAGDGTGQTIAIVDANDDPNIQTDLNAFDAQFGLTATTVTRVNENGGTSLPATDSTGGWELEESLDVEWAHAIAPGAKILLVEASTSNDGDLLAGVTYAASHANVVSLSWGGGEFSGQTSYDGDFSHPGVAFVASSGDSGAPISWPASSPNVLAVGGTSLSLSGSAYSSETAWSGSGGGPSAFEAQPAYQSGVVTGTSARANPDVAYNADPNTGYAIDDSFPYNGSNLGWLQIGGTSAGAPQWSALLAIADQGRALNNLPALDAASPTEVMTNLYKNATSGNFHDVTTGNSTGSPNYYAGVGYDYATGIGSPKANLVLPELVGSSATPIDHLIVSAPSPETAGASFLLTVTADNPSNATDAGYRGTIHFTSTDSQAGLPANYTFTAADNGVHTFSVNLKTAAHQTVTATDTATAATNGTTPGVAVNPAADSQFSIGGLPSSETDGASHAVTVTAKDVYGNLATGYAGTVHFASTDGAASLPATYTFTAADKGVHSFLVTFNTVGTQSLTVSDGTLSATQSSITVSPAAPVSLGATVASNTQINLSWSGAAGATGYVVQRSANGSIGWTQIGGTAAGVTTYSDTGLTAGTTYYYRVQATGGAGSAASNTASATTTGAVVTDHLWGSSVAPQPDSYATGSYEVGVKFTSTTAGTVTGVRFYKQTWMGGVTHVGHLWGSNGALLATVTFTNETASGWETATFSTPVSVLANSVYVASFSTGGGNFGISTNYFASAGVTSGPLQAPSSPAAGGNGVYGSSGSFPSYTQSGMNFWADVNFTPGNSSMALLGGGGGGGGAHAAPASATGLGLNLGATPTPAPSPATSPIYAIPPAAIRPVTLNGPHGSHATPPQSHHTANLASWPNRGTVAQALTFSMRNRFFVGS